jgi:hypothetical protein
MKHDYVHLVYPPPTNKQSMHYQPKNGTAEEKNME